MKSNLDIFRTEFLGAKDWSQRKDGVPLYLLDRLSPGELKTAESELIKSTGTGDDWPILGLGYIKSIKSLPILYDLLSNSQKGFKITIAYSIFQVCGDPKMVDLVLAELPEITEQHILIDLLYYLPGFMDERMNAALRCYCDHKEYLIAYNANRALERFRLMK